MTIIIYISVHMSLFLYDFLNLTAVVVNFIRLYYEGKPEEYCYLFERNLMCTRQFIRWIFPLYNTNTNNVFQLVPTRL
jgi:hypothetical protein